MSRYNIVFRNNDTNAIRELLKDIGDVQFTRAYTHRHLQRPKYTRNFYLESNCDNTLLVYKYTYGREVIMAVDGYKLPKKGWVRVVLN